MKRIPNSELLAHCAQNPIFHADAELRNHALYAKDAYERAVIFLRMIIAEWKWDDGWERKIDNCFEMSDGAAVCGWLLEFCDADPRIRNILAAHSCMKCGTGSMLDEWEKTNRNAHRTGELALA